jgi:hypothetical protein
VGEANREEGWRVTPDNPTRKLIGAVREMAEKYAPELGLSVEELTRLVLEKEVAVPATYRGVLTRQIAAFYGVLVQLQPASVDEAFVVSGRKKKNDTRPVLPKWAPDLFGVAEVETTFVELTDGRIVEEILTAAGPAFAVYTPVPEHWEIVGELEVDGTKYIPKPISDEFREILTLPDGVEPYENPAVLIDEMERLALDVFDPGDDDLVFRLTIRMGFASWAASHLFPPRHRGGPTDRYLPGLQAIGLPQSGKGRRGAIVQHTFYRTIYLLSTIRVPSIFRTISPWGWGSTLILDEADLPFSGTSSELVEFLNARCYGKPPVRYNSEKDSSVPFLSFGYTYVATREPYNDAGWNSRVLPLTSISSIRTVEPPLVVDLAWEGRAAKLRRQLLLFRFRVIIAVRNGTVKVPAKIPLARHFEPRLRAAFLPLFALATFDERLTESALELATEIERRQTANRADSWEGVVIGKVYEMIHGGEWKLAPVTGGPLAGSFRLHARRAAAPSSPDEPVEELVTVSSLRVVLPGEPKGAAIARVLKSIPMKIQEQDRFSGRRYQRILVIADTRRVVDAFAKYVVEPDLASIRTQLGVTPQRTVEESVADEAGEEGTP